MEELLPKLPMYAEFVSQVLGALVVIATAIVRVTPSKSDNRKVQKVADKVFQILAYAPTLGVNPKTKEMEKAYQELKK